MKNEVTKITIIGPESTGKSTLSESLAEHYNTVWCPEYAREYLLEHGKEYTVADLLKIAEGQLALEAAYTRQAIDKWKADEKKSTPKPLVIVDTDMYVMKVWSLFVFGKVDPFIEEALLQQYSDLYLLCAVDLPWVADELREYPDIERRETLFEIYQNFMLNQPVPWVTINGNYEERFINAKEAVDALLLRF